MSKTSGLQPETYVIPENFEGKFRIIYGETCGVEPKNEKGRRILEIPNNGHLIIKPKFKRGDTDKNFFFVDSNGKRKQIVELDNLQQRLITRPGVIMNSAFNVQPGIMPDNSFSTESPLSILYTEFTVFNKDTIFINQRMELEAKLLAIKAGKKSSLMDDLVEDCRKKNGR